MGGVGKTALALKLAEKIKERYPDGQFYLDLLGVSPQPLTPAKAMAHVIRSYYPGARLPESEDELRGVYLSVLHGQRALLLMDNARDRKQVEQLIPPAGCRLLVTSRQYFMLPGLFAKGLDSLPPADACKLLLAIAPRIGELAGEIARLCGYLPFALRLAASIIAERRNIKPADYMRQLADSQKRLELIDASLSLSYEILSKEQQQRWRMLAVFPDSFNEAAAAAVWETEDEEARDALGELLAFSLVEWNEIAGRYRLHDLARVFTASRLNEVERDGGRRLHARHFQEVLSTADDLFKNGGDGVPRGLALYDLERVNIEAAHTWAAEQAGGNEAAVWAWPNATGVKKTYYGIEFFEQQLQIARETGNLDSAYAYLERRSVVRRATEFHEKCLAAAVLAGDRRSEGYLLGILGSTYAELGETHCAINCYEQSLAIARKIGDRTRERTALGYLGIAYAALGERRRAIELHEQSLAIARETGNRLDEGDALWNMALALDKLAERAQAIARAAAALVIYEQIESPHAEIVRNQMIEWRAAEAADQT
jgi:tetratricopeptide (TPR) repeat protein